MKRWFDNQRPKYLRDGDGEGRLALGMGPRNILPRELRPASRLWRECRRDPESCVRDVWLAVPDPRTGERTGVEPSDADYKNWDMLWGTNAGVEEEECGDDEDDEDDDEGGDGNAHDMRYVKLESE